MRYVFIQQQRKAFPVRMLCRVMHVSSSAYYRWVQGEESPRNQENQTLETLIRQVFKESKETYGSPRITRALHQRGIRCGKHRVARLMREAGIQAKTKRRFRVTTDSDHDLLASPNLLLRQFKTGRPSQTWLSDISYVATKEGWLYLCVVLDLGIRKVVGWSMKPRMTQELVVSAINMAKGRQQPPSGLIFHSDRGRQYCSKAVRKCIKKWGWKQSMSKRGDCWDNAPMESFFGTLKTEEVRGKLYPDRITAKTQIASYIESFYNPIRQHSSLNYQSPNQFEKAMQASAA